MAALVDVAVSGARSSGAATTTRAPSRVRGPEGGGHRDGRTETGARRRSSASGPTRHEHRHRLQAQPQPQPQPQPQRHRGHRRPDQRQCPRDHQRQHGNPRPSRPAAHTPAATRTRTDAHAEAHARTHAPAGTRACDLQASGDDLLDLLATAAARTEARMTLQVEDETASPTTPTRSSRPAARSASSTTNWPRRVSGCRVRRSTASRRPVRLPTSPARPLAGDVAVTVVAGSYGSSGAAAVREQAGNGAARPDGWVSRRSWRDPH